MSEKPVVLELKNIVKGFDETDVLKGINLTVHEGEFITLLGSSGCGKTTTLRLIAGLDTPDAGEIFLEGKDVTLQPPNARNVNTVFQNYALFPHMTVFENIAYGLKLRKVNKKEIARRVERMLSLVMLEGFDKRYPAEMSGGQRQRVAIARALVNNPRVLLLDEPLGALDLQLRRQMQHELKRLQKKLGITFIYITHDQEEAINMSDRIAVMRDGRFEQIGTPREVYENPRTSYVARFVGTANVLSGKVLSVEDGTAIIENQAGRMVCGCGSYQIKRGQTYHLAVRSENIELCSSCDQPEAQTLCGRIAEKSYAGGMLRIIVELEDQEKVEVSRHGIDYHVQTGDPVCLCWKPEDAVFVDIDTTDNNKMAKAESAAATESMTEPAAATESMTEPATAKESMTASATAKESAAESTVPDSDKGAVE